MFDYSGLLAFGFVFVYYVYMTGAVNLVEAPGICSLHTLYLIQGNGGAEA